MTRKIHLNSKIFFSNPYVIRLYHEDISFFIEPTSVKSFLEPKKLAYKNIKGTWGYSVPTFESISKRNENPLDDLQRLRALFAQKEFYTSYWCFQHEIDALQFRMMVGNKAERIYMWNSARLFTIHEYIEENREEAE